MADDTLERVERACLLEIGLSAIRHDVRNKLAAVRQAAFFLKTKTSRTDIWESDARVEKFFRLIDDEVQLANGMLSDETNVERVHRRKFEWVDLHAAAERAASLRRVGDGIDVEIELEEGRCQGDPDEIAIAIRCLVENALDASAPGQTVRVCGTRFDDRYQVAVIDQGPGIPPELWANAHQPFVTSREGRVGVGLTMARRIARRSGGDVELARRLDGFTAILTLPESKPEEPGNGPGA